MQSRTVIPITPVAATDAGGGLLSGYLAQQKIYPRAVTGKFAKLRWLAVAFTQLIFYGLPWISFNDRQAVLFDLGARKFYLFGIVLWPQDFFYLAWLLVLAALSLFFFTAVAGRLWCGYACPQTVYTEIFSRIEHWVEGDRVARQRLDAAPWSAAKLRTKAIKHSLWVLLALWTGFTFIGYFAPIRTLASSLTSLNLGAWQWFWLFFYSFATWGNAGFMREQVCKYMCPYARFQGAMFDKSTLTIGYDRIRGEPRGSRARKADPAQQGLGSCIDCSLCVQVCPTGIDIRNGEQYECIGCAACVDVCDSVMAKMSYPPGLVRYATARSLNHEQPSQNAPIPAWRQVLRPRVVIYGTLLAALSLGLVGSLVMRNPLKVDVIRDRQSLARIVEKGQIENTYRLHLMNASESSRQLKVTASGIQGLHIAGQSSFEVAGTENRMVALALRIPPDTAKPGATPVTVHVSDPQDPSFARTEATTFIVPR